jgi:hypothetical protein
METLRREAGKKRRLIKRLGGFKMNHVGNKAIEVKLDRIKKTDKKPEKGIRMRGENGVRVNTTNKKT